MELQDKTVVITGAAHGIGRGLARRFSEEGAQVVCADIDFAAAKNIASEIGGHAIRCDVSREDDIGALIDTVETTIAPVDLFCANAGILTLGGLDVPDDHWDRIWKINVMSHVWTARHMVPRMISRGGGYIMTTASAAGLLNQPGAAPYGVTKHAAVGFAEWLALTVCRQRTPRFSSLSTGCSLGYDQGVRGLGRLDRRHARTGGRGTGLRRRSSCGNVPDFATSERFGVHQIESGRLRSLDLWDEQAKSTICW